MGGDKKLEQAEDHETLRHLVKFSKAFFIGEYGLGDFRVDRRLP
jgi:hypothetical protein